MAVVTSCVRLVQMERLRSFDFDAWRMQYLQWMKNNRSRIMDFFHRADTDGDGKVTRREFIDGIIKSRMSAFLSLIHYSSIFVLQCDDNESPKVWSKSLFNEHSVYAVIVKDICRHSFEKLL